MKQMRYSCLILFVIISLLILWSCSQRSIIQEAQVQLVVINKEIKSSSGLRDILYKDVNDTTDEPKDAMKKRLAYQQRIKEESMERLRNLTEIKRQNIHNLPLKSAFGTINRSSICQGIDVERCAPSFKMLETNLRFAREYKLMACLIQKSMSTLLQASMCYLHSEARFIGAGRVLNQESYSKRFCMWKNERNLQRNGLNILNKTSIHLTDDWMLLAVVRDPIDRFLSAFVDKCIRRPRGVHCNRCNANITCFIQSEYSRMMVEGRKERLERSFEDRHFFAQSWYCDFRSYFNRYSFIHYFNKPDFFEHFLDQFAGLLRTHKVPEASIQYIISQLKTGRTVNSTIQSEARLYFEKLLRSSPFLMEYIIRMYYFDFKLFKFDIPDIQFV